MSLRNENQTQKWHCDICKKKTIHLVLPGPPEASRQPYLGWTRKHACKECRNQITTIQVTFDDHFKLRNTSSYTATLEKKTKELYDAIELLDRQLARHALFSAEVGKALSKLNAD